MMHHFEYTTSGFGLCQVAFRGDSVCATPGHALISVPEADCRVNSGGCSYVKFKVP